MGIKQQLARCVDWLDDRLSATTLHRERPALISFLFHVVFENEAEIEGGNVWPAQPLQVAELAAFVDDFQAHGYRFVSPAELAAGLDPDGYYALLSFDDGYANNRRALPILRQRNAPATFFIGARNVIEGKAFWWDVLYRERRRRGLDLDAIRAELKALKRQAPDEIDAFLRRSFGADALRPRGESDRPLTVDELRQLARDPLVTIGNHTVTHADLTRLDDSRLAGEIRDCQRFLTEATGEAPLAIAYPNGRWNQRCIEAATASGLRMGFTAAPGKTDLPLAPGAAMILPRTFLPCGARLLPACARSRSDASVRRWLTPSGSR